MPKLRSRTRHVTPDNMPMLNGHNETDINNDEEPSFREVINELRALRAEVAAQRKDIQSFMSQMLHQSVSMPHNAQHRSRTPSVASSEPSGFDDFEKDFSPDVKPSLRRNPSPTCSSTADMIEYHPNAAALSLDQLEFPFLPRSVVDEILENCDTVTKASRRFFTALFDKQSDYDSGTRQRKKSTMPRIQQSKLAWVRDVIRVHFEVSDADEPEIWATCMRAVDNVCSQYRHRLSDGGAFEYDSENYKAMIVMPRKKQQRSESPTSDRSGSPQPKKTRREKEPHPQVSRRDSPIGVDSLDNPYVPNWVIEDTVNTCDSVTKVARCLAKAVFNNESEYQEGGRMRRYRTNPLCSQRSELVQRKLKCIRNVLFAYYDLDNEEIEQKNWAACEHSINNLSSQFRQRMASGGTFVYDGDNYKATVTPQFDRRIERGMHEKSSNFVAFVPMK